MHITKILSLFLLLLTMLSVDAQDMAVIDSLKKEMGKPRKTADKIELLDRLSRMLMNVNLQEAESYGQQLIEIAEESRDRELMVKAYLSNGTRCGYWAGNMDYTNKAIGYYKKAEEIARQNGLEKQVVAALVKLAAIQLLVPDKIKAAEYAGQAASKVSFLDNDSLKILVLNTQGDINIANNAKIEALRLYLSSLRLAEQIKNPLLERDSYIKLSSFYYRIEDYDRAIDYYTLAYKKLDQMREKNVPYLRVTDINALGALYAAKKNYELAIKYYERSLKMADSLKYSSLKVPGYVSLLNVYIKMEQPQKSLDFFNSPSGKELQEYLANFGLTSAIEQAYAVIYSELGNLDSARKYFDKSEAFFVNNQNMFMKMNHYLQTAYYNKKSGQNDKAIDRLLEVYRMAEKSSQLEMMQEASKELDTLYTNTGKYQLASKYNSLYYLYKDSLQKGNKEKEMAQVEAQDEQDRQEKATIAAAETKRQRNNIQYLAITIGIVALFVVLVLLGMFRVSARTIKMLGFFSFLMFFEFIFLIFKKNIYSITHGEPWMDLLFMIGMAAVLLPLHHWMEHKLLHYLTSQNRLTATGSLIRQRIFPRAKMGNE